MSRRIFVNGCFDILHVGHVRLLKYAASFGELTVAINSDISVSALKGENRPINSWEDRKEMLEAFDFVKQVLIFGEKNPITLLHHLFSAGIGPHVVVKGSDYRAFKKEIPERQILVRYNCDIKFFELTEHSTTSIVERARR